MLHSVAILQQPRQDLRTESCQNNQISMTKVTIDLLSLFVIIHVLAYLVHNWYEIDYN